MKPVWIVFAVVLAAYLFWRRRRLERTLLAGGAMVSVAALVYGFGVFHLPSLEHTLISIGRTLGPWTYLLVGGLAFLETGAFVGLVAPGETALLLGGVVAGQGQIDVVALIAIVWGAAVAGDLTSFFLGRRLGRAFLVKHGPKVKITEDRLRTVERFFDRHGGKAILLGRFVGLVRAIAPFLAGSSGLRLRRFIPYDVVGAGLWGATLVVLGYVFWQSFSQLLDYAKKGALALGAVIVVVVGIVWIVRWLRVPRNRERAREWIERQAQRPAARPVLFVLRPLWRALRGPARFVWYRLTPGELGLELTTFVAVASVGTFAFAADLSHVVDHESIVGDTRGLQWADDLRAGAAVSIAKVVTALGTLPAVIALVALAGVVLVWRREPGHLLVVVAGLVLTYAAVHITKGAVDRPRPPGALVAADGSSYPSAHAAYAITWIAVAAALTRALPSVASRVSLVGVSIVVAVAIGLSRVYLRVHYLSDVVAGWGMAAALYAVCAITALVVAYVRNNAPAHA